MKLSQHSNALEIYREEKIVYGKFLKPHRVLSTARTNGGIREDLEYLYNHQSCEARKHSGTDLVEMVVNQPDKYQERICSKAGIEPEMAAGLGTAANMNNTATAHELFEGLEVIALTTAGVGTNGGRAGDPASYAQTSGGVKMLGTPPPPAGTINILLFVNQEVTPGALVTAATLLAEAKASVLQELGAASRYSEGIATGTGTDQIGIAALLGTSVVHTDSNKHSKLGELIGKVVRISLLEALKLQSGLTPDSRRSSVAQLQRFGDTEENFISSVADQLDDSSRQLFKDNYLAVDHDPVTVSAVQACVHLKDQIAAGVLPESCVHEILLPQAALVAKAVSGKRLEPEELHRQLIQAQLTPSNTDFLNLIHTSFAIGFSKKWDGRFE